MSFCFCFIMTFSFLLLLGKIDLLDVCFFFSLETGRWVHCCEGFLTLEGSTALCLDLRRHLKCTFFCLGRSSLARSLIRVKGTQSFSSERWTQGLGGNSWFRSQTLPDSPLPPREMCVEIFPTNSFHSSGDRIVPSTRDWSLEGAKQFSDWKTETEEIRMWGRKSQKAKFEDTSTENWVSRETELMLSRR